MASVTFDVALGGDGSTVSDDADPNTGLDAGGHRLRFVPSLKQAVALAAGVKTNTAAALASANSAAASAGIIGGQTTAATAWTTGVAYTVGPPASLVNYQGSAYKCISSHTASASFATDLAANRWVFVAASAFTGGTLASALNEAPSVTLASAATVNIGAAASNNVTITGTTQISAFDTIAAGAERDLTFTGILTLKNNANILLPGGADIVTANGDVAEFSSNGSGIWKCVYYTKANGQAIAPSANFSGDTGAGGAKGLVPAPAAGDAAAKRFLRADGSWASGEMHLLNVLTASSSASLIDTTSITAAYDLYMIELEDIVPVSASQILMQVSTDNGTTWQGSNYSQGYSNPYTTYINISLQVNGVNGAPSQASGNSVPATLNQGLSGILHLMGPNATAKGKRLLGNTMYFDAATYNTFLTGIVAAAWNGNTAINALKFYGLSASLASGKIRIYGIVTA